MLDKLSDNTMISGFQRVARQKEGENVDALSRSDFLNKDVKYIRRGLWENLFVKELEDLVSEWMVMLSDVDQLSHDKVVLLLFLQTCLEFSKLPIELIRAVLRLSDFAKNFLFHPNYY